MLTTARQRYDIRGPLNLSTSYDLLLRNQVTGTHRLFRGYDPEVESSLASGARDLASTSEGDSSLRGEPGTTYAFSSLSQAGDLAEDVIEGHHHALDDTRTFRESR